jgi:ABC-type transport system involved in multi-copper enzyme maturation permease subunit
MTALTVSVPRVGSSRFSSRSLPGLRALVHKDIGEWTHGKRIVTVLAVVSLFMTLAAANGFISTWIIANVPEAEVGGAGKMISLAPLDNLFTAVGSQIFIFAAIFAAMSLIVRERETATLAWVASKPVSRSSIWVSKWITASLVLWIAAGLIPLALTAGVVTILYGLPSLAAVAMAAVGIGAVIALFVAVALAASTLVASQPAVAGITFGAFFLPTILTAIVPVDIAPFLPTSILSWTMGLSAGADVGFFTPIAWLVGIVALGVFSARQMGKLEL